MAMLGTSHRKLPGAVQLQEQLFNHHYRYKNNPFHVPIFTYSIAVVYGALVCSNVSVHGDEMMLRKSEWFSSFSMVWRYTISLLNFAEIGR